MNKLEVICKTEKEKEQLIDQLIDVIIEYNKTKWSGVFSCNCHDFVRDALEALHIEDAPTFKSRVDLGQYFSALKRGKVAGLQFKSHQELDNYVITEGKTFNRDEKEYLLCLYFQFHVAELQYLWPGEEDKWKCGLASCQCEELEKQMEQECPF